MALTALSSVKKHRSLSGKKFQFYEHFIFLPDPSGETSPDTKDKSDDGNDYAKEEMDDGYDYDIDERDLFNDE